MSLFRDNSRKFDQRLRLISAVVELPAEVDALRGRLAHFHRQAGRPILDRIAQAAIDGDSDLDLLWSAGLAENMAGPAVHNEVLTGVRNRIHNRIRQAYADKAVTVYAKVAAVFDTTAAKLAAAHSAVDIEASAETAVDLPDKQRKAWREAAAHAAELTRLLPALKSAAVLAALCEDTPDADLPLTVDCIGLSRTALWDAWTVEDREAKAERTAAGHQPFTVEPTVRSRCGRWSGVLRLGATIRACPADQFTEPTAPITEAVGAAT